MNWRNAQDFPWQRRNRLSSRIARIILDGTPARMASGTTPHLLRMYGLDHEEIIIRMTGCPNGCARPYIAEIGLVGTAIGLYNLHLGGDRQGERLNKVYRENLDESAILSELDGWLARYKSERKTGETFGDFAIREVKFK